MIISRLLRALCTSPVVRLFSARGSFCWASRDRKQYNYRAERTATILPSICLTHCPRALQRRTVTFATTLKRCSIFHLAPIRNSSCSSMSRGVAISSIIPNWSCRVWARRSSSFAAFYASLRLWPWPLCCRIPVLRLATASQLRWATSTRVTPKLTRRK